MKKQITTIGLWLSLMSPVFAENQNMPPFPIMAGQGVQGQMIPPNQGVAMDPGAYQSQFQGNGDLPPWAIQQAHLCSRGRFENTTDFNFGQGQARPGAPGTH